jgi:hypothetical protein
VEYPVLLLSIAAALSLCAAIGGLIADLKKRPPVEGMLLGLMLGPIGVAVEARLPAIPRPDVDENAWHSFRTVVRYHPDPTRTPRRGQPG